MATEKAIAVPSLIDDEETLRDIVSFDDAIKALESNGVTVEDLSDYGTGFAPLDKATLVGVPFVVIGYKFVTGTYGEMAILFVVTDKDVKGIIVDGSTGVAEQVRSYVNRGIGKSFIVRRGLTRSDYTYKDEKGNDIPATTYYLSE